MVKVTLAGTENPRIIRILVKSDRSGEDAQLKDTHSPPVTFMKVVAVGLCVVLRHMTFIELLASSLLLHCELV